MPRTAVVALGGNAFTRAGQAGTHDGAACQRARDGATASSACAGAAGHVVVVHGNGPAGRQPGHPAGRGPGARPRPAAVLARRDDPGPARQPHLPGAARAGVPDARGGRALVTHVVVAPDDPAFAVPTKPIGPFFTGPGPTQLARRTRLGRRGGRRPRLPPGGRLSAARSTSSRPPRSGPWSTPGRSWSPAAAAGSRSWPATAGCAASTPSSTRTTSPGGWRPRCRRRRSCFVTGVEPGAARLRHCPPSAPWTRSTSSEAERYHRRRPVPGGQHGPEDPGRDPVPARGRRRGGRQHPGVRGEPVDRPSRSAPDGAGRRTARPAPGSCRSRPGRPGSRR